MSEQNAVLFANGAFYAAFAGRDVDAMEKVWAKDKTVSCTHPGWQPLVGRSEVMASWRSILTGPGAPRITCRAERAVVYGDMAIVTCIEQISDDKGRAEFLTATNVFMRTGSIWAMVHHQAGPVNLDPQSLEEEEKPAVN
ncbi:MAG: nuclear transport factor 2 family protein [Rhodospirillaceae bacterium]|nr:nuclear transport factor 2 family protein [Rhodospirillaceae bacterium]